MREVECSRRICPGARPGMPNVTVIYRRVRMADETWVADLGVAKERKPPGSDFPLWKVCAGV